ncbi:universal stress protein [Microbacterium sp. E-13]|uniref:universal stress protein n=1 Tax=Microbacterium sp. E-13 TaxID=3404048 RepID=UPI003CF3ECC2
MDALIAVGVTDGRAARRARAWAIDRATESHDRLLLFSVVGESSGIAGESTIAQRALAAAELLLQRSAKEAADRGIAADVQVLRGKPLAQIIEISRRAQLVVIGSDRATADHPHRGPLAVRTCAQAHCPVVVVPDLDLEDARGIVVGVDGSEISERAVAFAAREAVRRDEVLTAVMSWSPMPMPMQIGSLPREYLAGAQQLTEENLAISIAGLRQDFPELRIRTVVEPSHPGQLIRREAAHARMAVVGSHGRGALGRFILGSATQVLLERPPTVMVIVR